MDQDNNVPNYYTNYYNVGNWRPFSIMMPSMMMDQGMPIDQARSPPVPAAFDGMEVVGSPPGTRDVWSPEPVQYGEIVPPGLNGIGSPPLQYAMGHMYHNPPMMYAIQSHEAAVRMEHRGRDHRHGPGHKALSMPFAEMVETLHSLSADQNGSRYVQQRFDECSETELALALPMVKEHATDLSTDPFGNYVVQKFIERATPAQQRDVVATLTPTVYQLSTHMYGCRVVQRIIELCPASHAPFLQQLRGDILTVMKDQHGNHVAQNILTHATPADFQFIADAAASPGQVNALSTHSFACRVLQRLLEYGTTEQTAPLVAEIVKNAISLAENRFGNYVVSHVIKKGQPEDIAAVVAALHGEVGRLSMHKFASNVIECCLEFSPAHRQALITELLTPQGEVLGALVKDKYGNYVVQKMLDVAETRDLRFMVDYVMARLPAMRDFVYGRHIATRVEQIAQTLENSEHS
ncbi:Pumilio-family RNA binding repeat [Carpediemonas membranifera]|uniref:Pumilio-family RNA binding repeat n=1 Tax=Carpediemonas membranifera TaxID=201153 RepID=A0A8J6ARE7_9EUKA|nr:Pumilio-family RNA binding repeat [Carpediemonas membranifera]|eukprot:KAG9392038.1 Pumilio-family RNA binding repeat [Carpediemonas membranifera]